MFELSNDNQRIIDKQVDDMKNKQQYDRLKKIICIVSIILFMVTILLIIFITNSDSNNKKTNNNNNDYQNLKDFNIKAKYYSDNKKIKLYGNLPTTDKVTIWTNGEYLKPSTKMLYCSEECEVYFQIDVSNCTSLKGMFEDSDIASISFSPSFNTKNIKDMTNLFRFCFSLKSADLSYFKVMLKI